jgi:hypothetical protein
LEEIQSKQADEHAKIEAEIIENVAQRKWTKGQFTQSLALLYIMGIRHGHERYQQSKAPVNE